MKISILTENTVYKRGFLGEHGLSLLIEAGEKRYLFDTGQSHVFLHNAGKLKVCLKGLDGIILSHWHYDHCGGMSCKAECLAGIPVYIQQKAFEKKYAENLKTGKLRNIGIEEGTAWEKQGEIRRLEGGCTKISEGVFLLSEIPYTTEFELLPQGFWRESLQSQGPELLADMMEDEQLLVMEDELGLCVFAGCAHPGIINCLEYVKSVFPGRHIHSLTAGMHLKGCSGRRVRQTIQVLQETEIDLVIPLHCTGIWAIGQMKEALKERCILAEAGKQIEL